MPHPRDRGWKGDVDRNRRLDLSKWVLNGPKAIGPDLNCGPEKADGRCEDGLSARDI